MSNISRVSPVVVLEETYPVRFRIKKLLEEHGLDTVLCGSVSEFFTPPLISRFPTDIRAGDASLFIIGMRLPDGNGLDVIKKLRESDRWRKVPIIALSHEASTASVVPALTLGVADYILKPFDEATFLAKIFGLIGDRGISAEDSLPTITFDLLDLISREISRAKDYDTNVSMMLASFVRFLPEGTTAINKCANNDGCSCRFTSRIRPALRDYDVVIPFGNCMFAILLPNKNAAETLDIKAQLIEKLEPVAKELESKESHLVRFVTSHATYPDDAKDWNSFMNTLYDRIKLASSDVQAEIRGLGSSGQTILPSTVPEGDTGIGCTSKPAAIPKPNESEEEQAA